MSEYILEPKSFGGKVKVKLIYQMMQQKQI